MNKAELCFLISYIDKAIFNLKRANTYDNIVENKVIEELEQTLLYYKIKLREMD